MTTPDTTAKTTQVQGRFRFPDPPEDQEDKAASFDHLTINGNAHYLIVHLGNRETTLVAGDHYLALQPTRSLAGVRYPDLLIAFGMNPAAYYRSNALSLFTDTRPTSMALIITSKIRPKEQNSSPNQDGHKYQFRQHYSEFRLA